MVGNQSGAYWHEGLVSRQIEVFRQIRCIVYLRGAFGGPARVGC
jgi:hypothetical protein